MEKVSRLYVLFQVFFGLLLWVPIFYDFQKQIGLNDPEIFRIQSMYYLAFLLFEIPTGFIADKFGYRKSMLMGSLVLIFSNILPSLSPNYSGMLAHFFMIAGARALISGAASAYLYDYLQSHGRATEYKDIEGKARSYGLILKIVCWSLVGTLMGIQIHLVYWLTAFNAAVAATCAFLLPDLNPEDRRSLKKLRLLDSIKYAAKDLIKFPVLVLLMLQGTGIFVLVRILQVNLFQPILGDKGFSVVHFGWVMAGMTFFEAIGARKSGLLRRKLSDINAVAALTIIISASLIFIALINSNVLAVMGFCVFSLAAGFAFPIQKQLLNDHIPPEGNRATILSVESILNRGFCALAVLPIGGLIAAGKLDKVLISSALTVMFAVSIIFVIIYFYTKNRGQNDATPNNRS